MLRRRQPQRVYLDSRFASPDGSIDIPGGINTHPESRCWLCEFSTTASWWTLDESNDLFYVIEKLGAVINRRTIVLSPGPYDLDSLADHLELTLNGVGKLPGMGTYGVTRTTGALGGGGSGGTTRCYTISVSAGEFKVPDEATIRAEYDIEGLTHSTNYLFAFANQSFSSSQSSGIVDLRRAHNLYIHAIGLGAYGSVGPSAGVGNVIQKIPVDVPFGAAVSFRFNATETDGIPCGTHSVSRIKLELRDAFGSLVSLNGGHYSCTLVFE